MILIPRRSFSALLRTLSACAALSVTLHAAEPARKVYDVPAADAASAFRTFSEVSGREILYPADAVRGVRTKAVKGELTDLEALERMLTGTGLVASVDEATGALAVRREDAAKKDPATPSPAEVAAVQGARPERAEGVTRTGEGAVQLSPFEVNSDRDRGFEANSLGTGGRMALDMRDAPVAFSAINREFIEALNITNMQDAAGWSTNASADAFDANGGGDSFGLHVVFNVRGQGSAGNTQGLQQRDYYANAGIGDSYNVERFEFGRGPNAALFGIGLLSGSQSAQGKVPRLGAFTKVRATVGSWDNYRTELDHNQPLTAKLGVRLNTVYQNKNGWMLNAKDDKEGLTLAAVYRLSPSAQVRLEMSYEKVERTQPYTILTDQLAGWDGKTVFQGPITPAMLSTTATPGAPNALGQQLTFSGEPQGVSRRGTGYSVFSPYGPDAILDYQFFATTRGAGDGARTPVYTAAGPVTSLVNGGNNGYSISNQSILYSQLAPDERFAVAEANSSFVLPDRSFTISKDGPVLTQRSRNATLTVDKQVGPDLFLQFGANINEVPTQRLAAGFTNSYRAALIDIDQILPNGQPNPRFRDVYADGQITEDHDITSAQALRVNAVYVKDFGRAGKYNLNINGSAQWRQKEVRNYALTTRRSADSRFWNTNDRIVLRTYWDDPARPYSWEMLTRPITYVDWDYTNLNAPVSTTSQVTPGWTLIGGRDEKALERRIGGTLQAKYFSDKLIFLLSHNSSFLEGERRDMVAAGDLPVGWNGTDLIFKPDAPADYLDLRYIPLNANGSPRSPTPLIAGSRPRVNFGGNNNGGNISVRNPLYADTRFRDDYNFPKNSKELWARSYGTTYHAFSWLSLKANYSNSYNPPDLGQYTLDEVQRVPTDAYSFEYGPTLYLFKGRVSLAYNHYQSRREHEYIGSNVISRYNDLVNANSAQDPSEEGINSLGYEGLFANDYQNSDITGDEITLQATFSRSLRGQLSYGNSETVRSSRFPLTRQWLPANEAAFVQLLESAGGRLDRTQTPSGAPGLAVPAPVGTYPAGTPLLDANRAITAYNQLYQAYAADVLNDGPLFSGSSEVVNGLVDYTFQSGPLRRFRSGLGVQWRGRVVLTDRALDTIVDPNNPTRAIDDPAVDSDDKIYRPSQITLTATFGYTLPLRQGRELTFNLVIGNLLGDDSYYYQDGRSLRPRDGDYNSPARVAVAPNPIYKEPRSVQFTTSLTF